MTGRDVSPAQVSLAGAVVLVTGAASGIGAETACLFSSMGAALLLVDRDGEALEAVRSQAAARGASAVALTIDLAEDGAEDRVAQWAACETRQLDALVHSAGIYKRGAFAESPLSDLDDQWRINVRAPYSLTRALLPMLAPAARIVFITSVAGLTPMRNRAAYCTTKAAAEMLMRSLALELAGQGIRVNAVAPGFTATPMNEALRRDPAFVAHIESLTPAGRLGSAREIAAAVLFLVSKASSFVYGETLRVDGGYPTPREEPGDAA